MLLDILPFLVIATIALALFVWLCCANEIKEQKQKLHDYLRHLDE